MNKRPQSAKPDDEAKSSRDKSIVLEKSLVEPKTPLKDHEAAPQVTAAKRPQSAKTQLGIEGYEVPRSLFFHNGPSYSIKKDKTPYFDIEPRALRKNPGPGEYEVRTFLTKEEQDELNRKRR